MTLSEFLSLLDHHQVSYRLDRVRDSVMVVVAIPGERWEVEFMDSGGVEMERFVSDGTVVQELAADDLERLTRG